jgi:endo-1,4-beta-D-glucanase Y
MTRSWISSPLLLAGTAALALGAGAIACESPPTQDNDVVVSEITTGGVKIAIPGSSVTASSNDGNVPANVVDGNLNTRWSASGDGQWLRFDLGATKTVAYIKVAPYSGTTRVDTFDVQTSPTGSTWTTLAAGLKTATNNNLQAFDFTDTSARYLRIVGHMNSVNAWNSFTEVEIYEAPAGGADGGAGAGGSGGTGGSSGSGGAHLFGSHTYSYAAGSIKPTGSASTLDAATSSFYTKWKAKYVKAGCGGYYVLSGGGTGSDVGDEVSEGHGYGMVITALMAGFDPEAKKIFDGMYAFFRKFPSSNNNYLMGWTVDVAGGCKFPTGTSDSATDGDLDIAFGLLLADKQWGSAGTINYLAEAKKVIAAIKKGDVNPTTHVTNLGDWAATNDYSTRPSDFMQDHFRAFLTATGDSSWTATIDGIYNVVSKIQANNSSSTGLMPDFVINTNTTPKPAAANFLEGAHDGDYDYNSCRNPWRLASDYLMTGEARSKAAVQKMNVWIKSKVGTNANGIVDGYKLSGSAYGSAGSFAFIAPFGVAAMVDSSNQAWLDAVWKALVAGGLQGYYEDSIKMQSMLVMSGNWWLP